MLLAAHFTNSVDRTRLTIWNKKHCGVDPSEMSSLFSGICMILYRAWVTEIIVSATLYTNEKTLTFYATALL